MKEADAFRTSRPIAVQWVTSSRRPLGWGTRVLGAVAALCGLASCADADAPNGHASTEEAIRLAAPTAVTAQGILRGARDGKAIAYKGIRYGENPVRFAPASPAKSWQGVRDAMAYGPTCYQRVDRPAPAEDPQATPYEAVGEEDCLFLNVWTPGDLKPGERLPVLFFIHGGGFVTGGSSYNPWFYYGLSGSTDLYDGKLMVERARVAVVTINYRLGALGFTSHPALTNAEKTSGNLGLEDTTLALQWVQRNIAAFGGDPKNVMVFGESAGAYATCALIASPRARGLFAKAGMQSEFCIARSKADGDAMGAAFVERLGCASASDIPACMRQKKKEEILAAQGRGEGGIPSEGTLAFIPTVDGTFLPDHPLAIIHAKKHNAVPVLFGSNAKEGSAIKFSPTVPKTWDEVRRVFTDTPELAPESEALSRFYGPWNFPSPEDAVVAFGTDFFMSCPLRQNARLFASSQSQPVYRYVFDADVPAFLGALGFLESFHGAELFYLFQNLNELPGGVPNWAQLSLESRMLQYWTSFGRTGRPAASFSPAWPPYEPAKDNGVFLADVTVNFAGYHAPGCDAYDRLAPPAH